VLNFGLKGPPLPMRFGLIAVLLASLVVVGSIPARAGMQQPAQWPGLRGDGWVKSGPAAVRLIAEQDGYLPHSPATLGVQIKLQPGWWTYWRAPGDAGLPPEFDWAGSRNLKWTPELFWPKPLQRTSFGHSIRVYRDEVVFPLRVVAADPRKPVKLKLNLTFGVCKEVCIPNAVKVSLELDPYRSGLPRIVLDQRRQIRRFEAEVPNTNPQKSGFRIQNVGVVKDANGGDFLAVELGDGAASKTPLVLIEMSPGEPPLIASSLGRASPQDAWRFAAGLEPEMLRQGPLAGKRIRVTIFDGGRSLEQIWVIGASADMSGRFGRAISGRELSDPMKPNEESWKPRD
jgi:suppressor for copper-sensitivity B